MTERKIIFKCRTGSHLYGTNRPESDEDFQGVFLPSSEDLLTLQDCPNEWSESVKLSEGPRNTKGDIDCKFYSLKRFMHLAAQGQPGALEMLFAPPSQILIATPEWTQLVANLDLFRSKKGIAPFIGFALSQAHKAVIKGENLNLIKQLIKAIQDEALANVAAAVAGGKKTGSVQDAISTLFDEIEPSRLNIRGVWTKKGVTDSKEDCIEIAGRKFNYGLTIKRFLASLQDMEERYGSRVRAAASQTYDYKSLGHAVRLLSEAREFLSTGVITLPRPDARFVKEILTGVCDPEIDWLTYITREIDEIRQVVEPSSSLSTQADWSRLNKLCQQLLETHLSL